MALPLDYDSEPFAALVQAAARAEAARQQRLAACGPQPAVGEVYVLPLPVPGPEQWVVIASEPERGVQLAPIDSASLPGTGEHWCPTPVGPRCVRLAVAVWLPAEALAAAERNDVWSLGVPAEQGELRVSDSAAEPEDAAARRWLAMAKRSARLLPAWLLDQTVAVDLGDPAEGDLVPLRARPPALAAAGSPAVGLYAQVAESLLHGSRRLWFDCRGGSLELGASLRAVGLRYVPDHDTPPPSVRCMTPGGAADLPWLLCADGSMVLSLRHDWQQPWRVAVDLPPKFVLQVSWSEVRS